MRTVRLTQIDGDLPNIALMKLAYYHREQGDHVYLDNTLRPHLLEPRPDIVYASSIFSYSAERVAEFKHFFPAAFVSGTGVDEKGGVTVEEMIGLRPWEYEHYDYSIYPKFTASIGFSQRGCRLACKFCGVSGKEGKAVSVNAIEALWRGPGHPRKIHLLDNDFFGQPDWREKIAAIRDGKFKVCLSQGINVRLINQEAAEALATIQYRNTEFNERQLYTAWDNIGHEAIFFKGVDLLERAGIPSKHLMAYMLIGYDATETWDRIWYRFFKMVDRNIRPYPMVYNPTRADLKCFQRWVIRGLYRPIPWGDYERETKSAESMAAWERAMMDRARMGTAFA